MKLNRMDNTGSGTEKKILEAAKKVFHERGFDGARMQEIADEAGVNKALVHYYYRNKANLFSSVFKDALQDIFSRLSGIAGKNISLEEKIRLIFNDYISFLQKNSFIPLFILAEMQRNPEKLTHIFKSAGISPSAIFEKMKDSFREESIAEKDYRNFFINVLSLCIFPFAAKPVLKAIFGFSEKGYAQFIEERKKLLPLFFMNAIRKK
jgi:TetR/AcrR family transcriptional regulator